MLRGVLTAGRGHRAAVEPPAAGRVKRLSPQDAQRRAPSALPRAPSPPNAAPSARQSGRTPCSCSASRV